MPLNNIEKQINKAKAEKLGLQMDIKTIKRKDETRVLSSEITNAVEDIATGAGNQAEESKRLQELASQLNAEIDRFEI